MLTLVAPAQTSRYRQKLQIWAFTAVIFIVFSILISLFRVKSRRKSAWGLDSSSASLTALQNTLSGSLSELRQKKTVSTRYTGSKL
jgi:hypothetical protein